MQECLSSHTHVPIERRGCALAIDRILPQRRSEKTASAANRGAVRAPVSPPTRIAPARQKLRNSRRAAVNSLRKPRFEPAPMHRSSTARRKCPCIAREPSDSPARLTQRDTRHRVVGGGRGRRLTETGPPELLPSPPRFGVPLRLVSITYDFATRRSRSVASVTDEESLG
jgi:hypothetical protein